MTAHSQIGASSMYRWAACPASVAASAGIESKSSIYAQEGTAAHALGERCLSQEYNASFFEGTEFEYDDHGEAKTIEVTEEMADYVQVYIDAVREAAAAPGAVMTVEERFHLKQLHPDLFGTADAVVWQPETKTLCVFDLKYGAGLPVEVTANKQLKYYALGALLKTGYKARVVEMTIVQPRVDHPDGCVRTQAIYTPDLVDFAADLLAAAAATEDPEAKFKAGDHCRFCPAAGVPGRCKEIIKVKQAAAKLEFAPDLPYKPEELAQALEYVPILKAWINAVDSFAYSEAEAGRCPPRYKLVDKRANRKWMTDDKLAIFAALAPTGVGTVNFVKEKLLSPAQIEKIIPKEHRGLLAALTVKESTGHSLVSESDKREAVKLSAKDDFQEDSK